MTSKTDHPSVLTLEMQSMAVNPQFVLGRSQIRLTTSKLLSVLNWLWGCDVTARPVSSLKKILSTNQTFRKVALQAVAGIKSVLLLICVLSLEFMFQTLHLSSCSGP